MHIRWHLLLLAALPFAASAQTALPPDIHAVTLSRLPPVTPADLDEEGQRLLAATPNFRPAPGPTHVTIYSPDSRSIGIPMGNGSFVGARNFQLATLIVAREIDQQFEWTMHEPAGLQAGLEQSVIDAVKHDRDVTGLSPADATFITFGRTLLREHKVGSELWSDMVEHFGKQGTVTLMTIMGEYLKVGIMLNAVDQHLPADREPLLPLERTTVRADEPITAQSLIDRAQITDLITRYYYNFGRENAQSFADFYADDAELILGTRSYKGKEGIESAYGRGAANQNQDRPARPQRYSFNVTISNPLIVVHGDTATSQVIFTEYVIQNEGDPLQVTTQGREYATFVRTAEGWRYKTRQIVGGDDYPEGWKE